MEYRRRRVAMLFGRRGWARQKSPGRRRCRAVS